MARKAAESGVALPEAPLHRPVSQWCLKYCTARSWDSAAFLDEKVPRLRRFPVLSSFLREYSRYWPLFNFLIMKVLSVHQPLRLARVRLAFTAAL
jgi:hypothetical protein